VIFFFSLSEPPNAVEPLFFGFVFRLRGTRRMSVVDLGDLRVGSIGLERFEYDLEFEPGTVGASAHGGCSRIGSDLQGN